MIDLKIIDHENYEDFIRTLQFRYQIYVEELSYIKCKHEHEMLRMEFDEFDEFSTFHVLESDNGIEGCARIVEDKGIGLPVYRKTDILEDRVFGSTKNIELGRLMFVNNGKRSKLFTILLNETFKYIFQMDCDYVFADTFKNGATYGILKKLGFQESGKEYYDELFSVSSISTLLYCKKEELRNEFFTSPNKAQQTLLKCYARQRTRQKVNF